MIRIAKHIRARQLRSGRWSYQVRVDAGSRLTQERYWLRRCSSLREAMAAREELLSTRDRRGVANDLLRRKW